MRPDLFVGPFRKWQGAWLSWPIMKDRGEKWEPRHSKEFYPSQILKRKRTFSRRRFRFVLALTTVPFSMTETHSYLSSLIGLLHSKGTRASDAQNIQSILLAPACITITELLAHTCGKFCFTWSVG